MAFDLWQRPPLVLDLKLRVVNSRFSTQLQCFLLRRLGSLPLLRRALCFALAVWLFALLALLALVTTCLGVLASVAAEAVGFRRLPPPAGLGGVRMSGCGGLDMRGVSGSDSQLANLGPDGSALRLRVCSCFATHCVLAWRVACTWARESISSSMTVGKLLLSSVLKHVRMISKVTMQRWPHDQVSG